jgi:DNA helicase-2/ATP-dependent DNA helicase PcrA
MLVGDVSQTIYSWRGAQPKTVIDFPAKWNAEVVMMGRNYRCGHSIVNAANKVLDAMDPNTKLPMSMICERGTESQIHVNEYANLDEEGEAISAQIVEEVAGGREYKDAYVLFRTNAQSRGIEEAMISNRIPYRILGATNFYERKEVRDLVAYLRLAEGRGDMEDIARCINSPFRFLGKAFVEKVQAVYRPNENTPVEAVRAACRAARVNSKQQVSAESWARLIETAGARIARGASAAEGSEDRTQALPSKILEDIFRDTGYGAWLIRDEGQETTENNRVSNCREMIRAAGRFTTAAELLDYIEKTVGRAKAERKTDGNTNKVTMMSLHRSKGLEAPVVFISGVNAGILPHRRAEDEEEERRLFYVGVTRAKDSLRLSYVRTITVGERVIPTEPSPFLFEAGLMVSPAEETVAC